MATHTRQKSIYYPYLNATYNVPDGLSAALAVLGCARLGWSTYFNASAYASFWVEGSGSLHGLPNILDFTASLHGIGNQRVVCVDLLETLNCLATLWQVLCPCVRRCMSDVVVLGRRPIFSTSSILQNAQQ